MKISSTKINANDGIQGLAGAKNAKFSTCKILNPPKAYMYTCTRISEVTFLCT